MKPSIPKGTRDFTPEELAKRNYLFQTMASAFENFGFQAIETPSFENLTTLMGKYGEEGDRLIFKILNSGNFLEDVAEKDFTDKNYGGLIRSLSDKALRYDLTVPFARYVVQHQNEIVFPFKRYQMQPVWRADRPQKGRFREFYQCDADVVGSDSLWQEIELLQLYDHVFTKLGLTRTKIKINNRKILAAFAEIIGAPDKLIDFTVALDKLDKIGIEAVEKEMMDKGISKAALEKVKPVFTLSGTNTEKLIALKDILGVSEIGRKGIEELIFVVEHIEKFKLETCELCLDFTLARGLNYYTGAIFEVQAHGVDMGSIGGGGRYDDLTGIFGLKGISGIGISFGLDRIYLVLEELNLLKKIEIPKPRILFLNFGDKEAAYCMEVIKLLRRNEVSTELYPESAKIKKQLNYADKREIPFVVIAGVEEMEHGKFTLKNMSSGEQIVCNLEQLMIQLKN
jgi:histidyl-tRNA synthetase